MDEKESIIDKIKHFYWRVWPYWARPSEIYYTLKCNFWHKYRTVKPRTLPGQSWVDRDNLLIHCCFEILTQFMEKELKGYKAEDWEYYYTEQKDSLIEFGEAKRDPYYVLDYLCRWWKFYLEKEDRVSEAWSKFNSKHCEHKFVPYKDDLLEWVSVWDSPENEKIASKMFKRYSKKSKVLKKELDSNLALLISLKDYLWT